MVLYDIIAEHDIIPITVSIIGAIKYLKHIFIFLDCFYGADLVFEQFFRIIFNTEGARDELSDSVEGGSYGYRMADGVPDERFVVRIKKWHAVSSFRLVIIIVILFNYKDKSADV